ncbi:MAG: transposase [Candidatus Eisenbacteria bacterium]|nr:transposase [Candidatus Eisenbacteria bacterium]
MRYRTAAGSTIWLVLCAVACLMQDLDDILVYVDMPRKDWKRVGTSITIERGFREVRRRVGPMTIFANTRSCDLILVGAFNKANMRWRKNPSPETQFVQDA